MKRKAIFWDIENIKYNQLHKYIFEEEDTKSILKQREMCKDISRLLKSNRFEKHFIRNDTFLPLKKGQERNLKKHNWNETIVPPGKDSSDNKIKQMIKEDIDKFSEVIIITSDNGFYDIIEELIKRKIYITVISEDKIDKLINKMFSYKETEKVDKCFKNYTII